MGTLASSEDPGKMQHKAAFHLDLYCLLRIKQPSVTEMHHNQLLPLKQNMPYLLYQYASEYKGFLKLSVYEPVHKILELIALASHRVGGNRKSNQQSPSADQKTIETVFLIGICRQWGQQMVIKNTVSINF